MVWNGFVQFKLDFFEPVGYIRVVDGFYEDGPRVCVIFGDSCWLGVFDGIERSCSCAIYKGAED